MRTETMKVWKSVLCIMCIVAAILPLVGGVIEHDLTYNMAIPRLEGEYEEYLNRLGTAKSQAVSFESFNRMRNNNGVLDIHNTYGLLIYIAIVLCILSICVVKKSKLSILFYAVAICLLFVAYNYAAMYSSAFSHRWTRWALLLLLVPSTIGILIQCFCLYKASVPERKPKVKHIEVQIAPSQSTNTDALTELAKLHEQGILTDDEFNAKKADILAKM